jgi:hypothetical protein
MIFCRWLEAPGGEDPARRGVRNGRETRPPDRRDAERREERWGDPTTAGTQPISLAPAPAEKHAVEPAADPPLPAKVEPL